MLVRYGTSAGVKSVVREANLFHAEESDQGTFGTIHASGLVLFTGELPWRDNVQNFSRVPPAPNTSPLAYICRWTWSPLFQRMMYALEGVPMRIGCRAHSANYCGDVHKGWRSHLNGCIGMGEKIGWMEGQKCLLLSRPAIMRFEDHMKREPFKLVIHA